MQGIQNFFGGGSDRRLKTHDITRVGSKMGVPIHAYRYKGDPKSYPKVVGPMAEDVAEAFRARVGGKDPRIGRQDGGSPGGDGRAGRSPWPRNGSADCSECHGRAADAWAEPCRDRRRAAADGRNGPAGRRGRNGRPTDAGA